MTKPTWRELLLLLGLAGVALVLLNHNVVRAQQSGKPAVFTQFKSKLALDGYDAVAYFKTGQLTKGSAQHAFAWNGATWQFASAENKAAFEASPQAYAPQYGGYCAYGVTQDALVKVEPEQFTVRDGKLYLNYDADVQAKWLKDTAGYIKDADARFPGLLKK